MANTSVDCADVLNCIRMVTQQIRTAGEIYEALTGNRDAWEMKEQCPDCFGVGYHFRASCEE